MNNIIIIGGILFIAAIVVAILAARLRLKNQSASCEGCQECSDTCQDTSETDDVLKQTSDLIKDLPPVDGPAPEPVDSDNPYTITNNEPLIVGEKSTIEDLCGKVDSGEIIGTPIMSPEIDTPAVKDLKPFDEFVKETSKKPSKRGRKKKESVKTEKKSGKKVEKKTAKKTATRKPRTKKEA